MENINLSALNREIINEKAVEIKLPDKEAQIENAGRDNKKLKLALTGLAVIGTAVAAGVAIYKGKSILAALGQKTQERAAEQVQQLAQTIQRNEPSIPVPEKLQNVALEGVQAGFSKPVVEANELIANSGNEFCDLIAKKDELSLMEFKKLAGLMQDKTEEQKAELARIITEKTQTETLRRTEFLNGKISNWDGQNDEYIKTLMSCNDEQFEIIETMLNSKTRRLGAYYQENPEKLISNASDWSESLPKIEDETRLQKILEIVSKDKGVKLEDAINISTFDETMFKRASMLTDRGLSELVTFENDKVALEKLDDIQFGRILGLSDKGYVVYSSDMLACAKLDDKAYERAVLLCEKYGFTSGISSVATLPDEEFQKVIEKLQAGVPSWLADKLTDEEFKNFQYLLNAGARKDIISSSANLADRAACEKFLEQQNVMSSKNGMNVEDLKNPEIKAGIVAEINSQFGYEKLKPDCDVKDIAWCWRQKYIEGGWLNGGYSDSCIDAFLEKTLPRYEIKDGEQLGRWMRRDDLCKYIQDFPEVGETYTPGRIQSFAKTLNGAERYRGNNFSDSNIDLNVKMVVTPKAKLTQAFDMGEGKYGSDEAIYGATQEFEVLNKGFEIVTNPDGRRHRQYVIYLKEK